MYNGLIDLPWWGYIVYTLIVTHITIAGVTIYLHRHSAHRALELHPIVSHFFRFWLWLTTGMVTKQWTAIHRKHHAKCETPEDPHSPQILGLKKVLWQGAELYRAEAKNDETMKRYGAGTPDDWMEHHVYSHSVIGVSILMIINLILFGPIGLTIWAVQMAWIPFWAAGVVNGVAHYYGYRNFTCPDASTNLVPWGILIGGEELHNNHHTYATSAKLSNKWYEFDIGWVYIRLLEMLGLAKVKKLPPKPVLSDLRQASEQTLQAVITNRYEIMARYAKVLRQTFDQEVGHMRELAVQFGDRGTWLYKDESKLNGDERERLEKLMSANKSVQLMVEMRRDLATLWERSHVTKEQLLARLQAWCHKAEASGLTSLQDFSLRLRRYAA